MCQAIQAPTAPKYCIHVRCRQRTAGTLTPLQVILLQQFGLDRCRPCLNLAVQQCAAAGDIYDVFLNEGRVKAFTMSDATVSRDVDGKFSMFGGSIEGVHRELLPGKKIVQDWRFTTWDDNVYSLARSPPHRYTVLAAFVNVRFNVLPCRAAFSHLCSRDLFSIEGK